MTDELRRIISGYGGDPDEWAFDDDGAYAASAEAVAELDAALKTWAAKHLSDARVWRCVGKPRELRVTAADVAEYGQPQAGKPSQTVDIVEGQQ